LVIVLRSDRLVAHNRGRVTIDRSRQRRQRGASGLGSLVHRHRATQLTTGTRSSSRKVCMTNCSTFMARRYRSCSI